MARDELGKMPSAGLPRPCRGGATFPSAIGAPEVSPTRDRWVRGALRIASAGGFHAFCVPAFSYFPSSRPFFRFTGLFELFFFPPYSVTFPSTTTPIYRPAERNCITLCPARANCAYRDSVFGFCSSPRSTIFVSRMPLRESCPSNTKSTSRKCGNIRSRRAPRMSRGYPDRVGPSAALTLPFYRLSCLPPAPFTAPHRHSPLYFPLSPLGARPSVVAGRNLSRPRVGRPVSWFQSSLGSPGAPHPRLCSCDETF
jgi:hypothetical protein